MASIRTSNSIGSAKLALTFGLRCRFPGIAFHHLTATRKSVIRVRGFKRSYHVRGSDTTTQKDDWRGSDEEQQHNSDLTILSRERYYGQCPLKWYYNQSLS